jgi:hypothetical protein
VESAIDDPFAEPAMVPTLLLVIPFAQAPAPAAPPDTLVWPPVHATPQLYTVRLHKARELDGELAAAEKAARKELGLPVPAQPPRQSVAVTMDVEVRGGGDEVQVRYTTRLGETRGLRLQLRPADAAAPTPPPLGNEHVDAVWGLADAARQPDLVVSRAALERTFEQRFRRQGAGVAAADFGALYGDHLLPVLWDQPLPCWIGHMAAVLDLGREAAIDGKTLIRDGSGQFPLGHRETRVELAFTKVAGRTFTIRYELKVQQTVHHSRDLRRRAPASAWTLEIEGEADYSAAEQGFERITERVRARPGPLDQQRAARLRDEAFAGTIEVARVRAPAKGSKPRK